MRVSIHAVSLPFLPFLLFKSEPTTARTRSEKAYLETMRVAAAILLCSLISGCRGASDNAAPAGATSAARNLVIITIDTLRDDRVGA